MGRHEDQSQRIEIVPAPVAQKSTLANLLELYSHDFSEFIDLDIGADGRFGYPRLDLYWIDPNRRPFLLYVQGKLAGFLLVDCIAPDPAEWDMAEFFVMRGFRKQGIGTHAAQAIFASLPGHWRVRVMRANAPACRFWSRAVHAFAGNTAQEKDTIALNREWIVFSFDSPPPANRRG